MSGRSRSTNEDVCECGLSYSGGSQADLDEHGRHHGAFLNGHRFPSSERIVGSACGYPIADARPGDPVSVRKPFAELAMLAQRATPEFRAGYYGSEDEDSVERWAFAALNGERAIALVFTQVDQRAWPAFWRGGDLLLSSRMADTSSRRVVQRAWVAGAFRRRGLAKAMIREVARILRDDVHDLAWEGPFTDSGLTLLRSICPDRFCLTVGDIGDLRNVVAGVEEHGGACGGVI